MLVTPGRVFVGRTARTNADGARQLASIVAPYGFETIEVPVTECLHLKSAVSCLRQGFGWAGSREILLINPRWVDPGFFAGCDLIEVDPDEPAAANVLRIADTVICAEEFPRTRARLESYGFVTASVPASELAKAEGGITCCSLVVRVSRANERSE